MFGNIFDHRVAALRKVRQVNERADRMLDSARKDHEFSMVVRTCAKIKAISSCEILCSRRWLPLPRISWFRGLFISRHANSWLYLRRFLYLDCLVCGAMPA